MSNIRLPFFRLKAIKLRRIYHHEPRNRGSNKQPKNCVSVPFEDVDDEWADETPDSKHSMRNEDPEIKLLWLVSQHYAHIQDYLEYGIAQADKGNPNTEP